MIISASVAHSNCSLTSLSFFSKTHQEEDGMMLGLIGEGLADEVVVIKTCNRYEIYVETREEWESFRAGMERTFGKDVEIMKLRKGNGAVFHLFEVATTLDSMIIGEHQILGQVKGALEHSKGLGTAGETLIPLFEKAIRAGKRVRSETDLCQGNVSIASVAVGIAEEMMGPLDGKNILILGAGKISAMVAKILSMKGGSTVFVTNRRFERAKELAGETGANAIAYELFRDHLPIVDLIFCASSAPHALLFREDITKAREQRMDDITIIDVAMPPDVDAEARGIEGTTYVGLDKVREMSRAMEAERRMHIPAARRIIREEYSSLMRQAQLLERKNVVRDISLHAEAIREAELEKLLSGSCSDKGAVEAFSKAVVKRTLHNLFLNVQDLDVPMEKAYAVRDLIIRNAKDEDEGCE
ncbi:MAG TPA: glutamyl-tRNA reductase [Candidatus Methanofastidiosa archaeon]|nr:glutamyl-tRNA reductase [Candidatus Methanofastidiosa archaeon]